MQTIRNMIIVSLLVLLVSCKPHATQNFQQLTPSNLPNHYLVCPPDYCSVPPNAYAPVFAVSAEDLFNVWNETVAQQSFVNYRYSIPEQGEYGLVQRTIIFGLPDDITVQFIALSPTESTLAILSRSRYGWYDFGTNQRRIKDWLQAVADKVAVRG